MDYDQTFSRNYDPAIGRFIASDPMPESSESMTTYQYAGNNPVMMNDPMGNNRRPGNGGVPGIPYPSAGEFADESSDPNLIYEQAWDMAYGAGLEIGQDITDEYVGQGAVIGYVTAGEGGTGVYGVDKDGAISSLTNVSFHSADNSNSDVLFAEDANGQFNIGDSPFVDVDPGILDNQQHGVYQANEGNGNQVNINVNYYNFDYSSNTIGLFEFLAKNTSVEWSLITYMSGSQKMAYLGTDEGNKSNIESASFSFGLDKFLGDEVKPGSTISVIDAGHSHPAGQDFHGPSGYFPKDPVKIGDLQLIQYLQSIPQLQNIHLNYWIYDVDTGYFKYNANSNYDNSKISGPYKNYLQITNP